MARVFDPLVFQPNVFQVGTLDVVTPDVVTKHHKWLSISVPGSGRASGTSAFAVSRDSAGILIGVRDNAAPQFAVSRDASGLLLSVLPAPVVACTYAVPVIDAGGWNRYVRSFDYSPSYAAARAGTSGKQAMPEGSFAYSIVGQGGSGHYEVVQSYLRFDTSVIPDDEVVSSAVLAVPFWGVARDSDFTIEARVYDAGPTVEVGDYVPGADLSTKTLFATLSTLGLPDYIGVTPHVPGTFIEAAGAADAINKSGITGILLCSDHTTNNVPPTGNEYVWPCANVALTLTITTNGPA